MKKIFTLLFICILLCGCNKKTQEKIYLEDNLYSDEEFIDVTSTEINDLENSKKSFVVFVHLNFCTSCSEFKKVLIEFSENHNISFYSIEFSEVEKTKMTEFIKYSPSVVIYNEGEVYAYLDPTKESDLKYYESVNEFKKWFTTYVELKA